VSRNVAALSQPARLGQPEGRSLIVSQPACSSQPRGWSAHGQRNAWETQHRTQQSRLVPSHVSRGVSSAGQIALLPRGENGTFETRRARLGRK
jgi:hypothetical protein